MPKMSQKRVKDHLCDRKEDMRSVKKINKVIFSICEDLSKSLRHEVLDEHLEKGNKKVGKGRDQHLHKEEAYGHFCITGALKKS